MKVRTFKLSRYLLAGLFVLLVAGNVAAIWWHAETGRQVTTSIAAPTATPREIDSTTIDSSGNLIITYSDGSVSNVGRVVGESGEGLYPTQEQLDDAVLRYCADGRCDADNPTQTQVLQAVATYCSNGTCRGKDGQRGPAPTAEQLQAAVTAYCSNGQCRGATGLQGPAGATGAQGAPGRTPQMACVQRTTNNTPTRYVAWKYTDEPNSAYRDLYQLPPWAQCTNPVDLTT